MTQASDGTATESPSHQDKHKAPTLPHIHPLSLQDEGGGFVSLLHSVGKVHQDARGRKRPYHYRFWLSKFIRTEMTSSPYILPCPHALKRRPLIRGQTRIIIRVLGEIEGFVEIAQVFIAVARR